jgi:2-[(L-alanin-3-ylcarbamoyl)methyl]-3-(2-aminoethylcarbamoyl)-2-hydroxypropanoate synthase
VRNAAPISDWLRGLVAADPVLRERVVVLGETRGTTVRPSWGGPGAQGVLGAIWREPLAPHLREGERAVPATALTARERDDTPVVARWIAAHGAETWVRAWAAAVAAPLVAVLQRHGVALESHTQNVSVTLVEGLPARVVVRDFHDGVRFSRALLADPGAAPAVEPPPAHHTNRNSFLETEDPAQVADFLLDAFFFVHAGELGLHLHEHGLLDERRFWALLADALPLAADGPFELTAPTLQVERLTTRRLGPDTELALHTVPNPLHRPGTAR